MELGYIEGEICNRNGCKGVIDLYKEGSCNCHSCPPCSYCTTDGHYCPECDWSAEEDYYEDQKNRLPEPVFQYKSKTIQDLDRTKIDYIKEMHTHFSMKVIGVFPIGTNRDQVFEKVKGTFGGRFISFDTEKGNFVFIAYTD